MNHEVSVQCTAVRFSSAGHMRTRSRGKMCSLYWFCFSLLFCRTYEQLNVLEKSNNSWKRVLYVSYFTNKFSWAAPQCLQCAVLGKQIELNSFCFAISINRISLFFPSRARRKVFILPAKTICFLLQKHSRHTELTAHLMSQEKFMRKWRNNTAHRAAPSAESNVSRSRACTFVMLWRVSSPSIKNREF